VELRGLEPLTPCLQNRPRLSDVLAHLGLRGMSVSAGIGARRMLLWSGLVVSVGQLHWAALHSPGWRTHRVSVLVLPRLVQGSRHCWSTC
jgi:hypothetical protein